MLCVFLDIKIPQNYSNFLKDKKKIIIYTTTPIYLDKPDAFWYLKFGEIIININQTIRFCISTSL